MKTLVSLMLVAGIALPFNAFAIGALAVDDAAGEEVGYGFFTGANSEASAKSGALKECKKAGNDNCRVLGWFKTCGAYAASKNYYGYGFGATKGAAETMARKECGNSACKIRVSECEE